MTTINNVRMCNNAIHVEALNITMICVVVVVTLRWDRRISRTIIFNMFFLLKMIFIAGN